MTAPTVVVVARGRLHGWDGTRAHWEHALDVFVRLTFTRAAIRAAGGAA